MFKVNNELLPDNLEQLFNVKVTILHVTRQSNDIKCISLKSINCINKLLCNINYLVVYMCKWVSVIRYLVTIIIL